MTILTASGIERDGRMVVDIEENEFGAFIIARGTLDASELRHVAKLAGELAVNAEKRALSRDADLPAVGSFWGC